MTKQLLCLRTSCSARLRVQCGILPRRPQDVRCEHFRQIFALWLYILRIPLFLSCSVTSVSTDESFKATIFRSPQ